MEMTNFQPESRDMAIFGKSPCQKVVKLHQVDGHSVSIVHYICPRSFGNSLSDSLQQVRLEYLKIHE